MPTGTERLLSRPEVTDTRSEWYLPANALPDMNAVGLRRRN